jgi:hypothetical protein
MGSMSRKASTVGDMANVMRGWVSERGAYPCVADRSLDVVQDHIPRNETYRVKLKLLSAEIHSTFVVVEDGHLKSRRGARLLDGGESIGTSEASEESGSDLHGGRN